MIRVAQEGWVDCVPAKTVDEVRVGIGCYWVEIDGVRIDKIVRAEFVAAEGEFSLPRLVIDVAAGMEIVYVDRNGEPLPGAPVPVAALPDDEIDYHTIISRDELVLRDDAT
jgi:hypothetical protein